MSGFAASTRSRCLLIFLATVHAEVTELLSNVIYQHRRRAGQGGRSPRKESPLGRAVVWRVLRWSQARCGFEGRRRNQAENNTAVFSWSLQVHESVLLYAKTESDLPSIEPSFSSSFPPPTQQAAALWSGRGEGQRAPCHRAPLTHTRCSITYKPSTTKQQPPPQHTERTQHTYPPTLTH